MHCDVKKEPIVISDSLPRQTLLWAVALQAALAACGPVAAPYASDYGYTFNPLATVVAPAAAAVPASQYHAQV